MDRYIRQISLPEIGEEGQNRLKKAKVLIVGVGGLGSPTALYLVAAGVGQLGIVDADIVGLSNLQRQILYSESEQGEQKVYVAKKRLNGLNSHVEVVAYPEYINKENIVHIISDYDIVVDGCDNFETRYLLSDTCMAMGKTYVYGAIEGFMGQVALFDVNHSLKTYRDLYPDCGEGSEIDKAVVGTTAAVVGAVQAHEVLKVICGYGEPLWGRLWYIDLRTMQSGTVEL